MPVRRKLTPIEVLERLQLRLQKRMETLQRVKLDGYDGHFRVGDGTGLSPQGEALLGGMTLRK
jgi:hypothetical protein